MDKRKCDCGNPTVKYYSEVFGRDIHSRFCEQCETKQREFVEQKIIQEQLKKIENQVKRTLPKIYQHSKISDLNPQLAEAIHRKPVNQGLFLWGPVGTGKTYAAAAVVRHYIEKGNQAKFVDFADLLLDIRNCFRSNGMTERQILEPLLNSSLLVLDDIGTNKNGGQESEFTTEVFRKLINHRINELLPTVITSNLSPENLGAAFGERIASRLKTFAVVKLGGKDKRQD